MKSYRQTGVNPGPESIKADIEYVATLGDPLSGTTCSMQVAEKHFPHFGRLGSESFEEASYMVVGGSASVLLVPAAYPKVSDLLMRSDLRVVDTFTAPIPELVLVVDGDVSVLDRTVLYYHPATMSLIEKIEEFSFKTGEQVLSNDVAVTRIIDNLNPGRLGAITNRVVADHYGYEVQQVLRPAVNMAWLVFRSAEGNQ